jgi:hypothetical protein
MTHFEKEGWVSVIRPIFHPVEGEGCTLAIRKTDGAVVAIFESGRKAGFSFKEFALICVMREECV